MCAGNSAAYPLYFGLLSRNRQQNEIEVAIIHELERSKRGAESFHSIHLFDDDPPDLEAVGKNGERIGIEVTELCLEKK